MDNQIEPYVGPRPFSREDEAIFYGRDREANELLSLIIAHPVVMLYAQSGAGKTSLLNAKVIPLLEGRNSEVFGSARVSGELPPDVKSDDVKNIYVFNALLSLQKDLSDPQNISRQTLTDFLQSRPATQQAEGVSSRRIIIFDQFEEIFTTSPERWQDRTDFFDNVGAALEADPRLRVVFAMREDYIANMDPFADALPERLRTRFRLERLREEAALQAVKKPLANTGRAFAPGAADKLVKNLLRVPIKSATGTIDISGEYVEPVQLQVVCKSLWQSLPPDADTIDETYIENYGDVDRALSTYYEDCIRRVAQEKGVKEGELRRWFGKILITSDGTRGTVYKDEKTTGGLHNGVVDELENLRLVRPELRGGAPWYELTHDRFISPILKSNQDWFNQRDEGLAISKKLEAQADQWILAKNKKPEQGLLTGQELTNAREWIQSPDAEEIGVSNSLREFFQASQTAAERERAERQSRIASGLRRQRALLAGVVVIAMALAVVAVVLQSREKKFRKQADNATLIERGKIAETLSQQPGKEFDALVLGIKALEAKPGDEPPAEAVKGLRAAVKAVGNSLWLRQISSPVQTLEISSDGKYVLTTSNDRFYISDVMTGELTFSPEPPQNSKWHSAHFSPDGKMLFSINEAYLNNQTQTGESLNKNAQATRDEKVTYRLIVWDISTKRTVDTYKAEISDIVDLIISPNNPRMLANDANDKWYVLDAATGKLLASFPEFGGNIKLSPQGTRAVVIGVNGDVALYDVSTGKAISTLVRAGDANTLFVNFSDDDTLCAAGIYNVPENYVAVWNIKDGKRLFKVNEEYACLVGFIPNEKKIAVFDFLLALEVTIYETTSRQHLDERLLPIRSILPESPYARIRNTNLIGIEFPYVTPDAMGGSFSGSALRQYSRALQRGQLNVMSKGDKSSVFSWDFTTGNIQRLITDNPVRFRYVDVSDDPARIFTISENEVVQIWDYKKSPVELDKLNVSELKTRACEQIRYQKEFREVETQCK